MSMSQVTHGSDTQGPLSALWAGVPFTNWLRGYGGVMICDSFIDGPSPPSGTLGQTARYNTYYGTSATILCDAEAVGAVKFNGVPAADNVAAAIQQAATPFKISGITGSKTKKLIFEARVKLGSVADTICEAFVGLCERATLADAVPITATAATMADQNLVGFYRTESDGDKWQFVYKANGVTQVISHATLATPVADTYNRLGFIFDPEANTLKTYVDGVLTVLTTPIISTQLGATAGTDFPNDAFLGVTAAIRNAAGTPTLGNMSIDWWACGQSF